MFVLSFQTTFSVSEDIALLKQMIADAIKETPKGEFTVFFIGEAHSDPFDVERRQAILEKFVGHRGCLLVTERTFADNHPKGNIVHERSTASSSDPSRNEEIVKALLTKLDGSADVRTVVFLFGEDHEFKTTGEHAMIRERLEAAWKKTEVIWYSCPSVTTALAKLPVNPSAMFIIKGRPPAGYVVSYTNAKDYKLAALEKGHLVSDYNVKLLPVGCAEMGNAFAIYYEDSQHNSKIRNQVNDEGEADVTIVRLGQVNRVTARRVARNQLTAAEDGALS